MLWIVAKCSEHILTDLVKACLPFVLGSKSITCRQPGVGKGKMLTLAQLPLKRSRPLKHLPNPHVIGLPAGVRGLRRSAACQQRALLINFWGAALGPGRAFDRGL